MANFLALLGWSKDGETDVFTREELVAAFSWQGISRNPAVWDIAKLQHLNGVHIRAMPPDALASLVAPFVERGLGQAVDPAELRRVLPVFQDRIHLLAEAPELMRFVFADEVPVDRAQLTPKGADAASTGRALEAASVAAQAAEQFEAAPLEAAYRELADRLGWRAGQLFSSIRVALTGSNQSPPLFDTMWALGRAKTVARLGAAAAILGASAHS
jgi:glutamyl-tRNA synthetase